MTHCHPLIHHLAHNALRSRALEFSAEPITLGHVTLLPHQVAAVHWLQHRITVFGGALLADPPGTGKTYVALAVASLRATKPLVIAPASLRTRWRDAARETNTALDFISTERLSSPSIPHIAKPTFVIIDEAHHLRTPHTRRHQRTATLCNAADVLLLSATPIHNHTRDLENITALFHLPASRTSVAILRQRLTLRRSLIQIQCADNPAAPRVAMPRVRLRHDLCVPRLHSEADHAIMALTPLIDPQLEGHRLLQLGLLHALRSSDAAIRERIRRRVAVTLAIEHAALAHIAPTHAITRAFRAHDGDVQLAMPQLLGNALEPPHPRLASAAARQRAELEAMLPLFTGAGDIARSHALRRLARWCTHPVVAFTQFNATAFAFYRLLRHRPGIALLGGTTAHITSGVIPRDEVIARLLDPRHRTRHDAVRLLITSDVLSEGISLAGVATIVHLDLPWTAARVDQRVGRAARIGAPVSTVHVVRLPAPLPPQMHDTLDRLISRKRGRMARFTDAADDEVALMNALRELSKRAVAAGSWRTWITVRSDGVAHSVSLAIVRIAGRRMLIARDLEGVRRASARDWMALLSATIAEPSVGCVAQVRRALREWRADHELTAVVADPRDQRVRARRAADHRVARADRVSRIADARESTALRQQLMYATRGRKADINPQSGLAVDTTIQIFAGLTILPRGHGE